MENKPSKNKEDYTSLYEYRRQWLGCFEKDEDMDYYPKSFSFFCKQNGTPVSGKVFTPPQPDFKCEIDIKKCFAAIKEQMTTKSGQPRASMLKLKDYEITAWAALLEYLRFSWQENETKVLLTGKEYYMIFPSKQIKKK